MSTRQESWSRYPTLLPTGTPAFGFFQLVQMEIDGIQTIPTIPTIHTIQMPYKAMRRSSRAKAKAAAREKAPILRTSDTRVNVVAGTYGRGRRGRSSSARKGQ